MANPSILLTNDDGIDAPGLRAVREPLAGLGDLQVVAPAADMSGVGRALSLGRGTDVASGRRGVNGVTVDENGYSFSVEWDDHDDGYAIEGTPCECVIVGHERAKPDVVVSGCNPGANTGLYTATRSGTVSAAMEGAMLGTPSIALSMEALESSAGSPDDFERAGRFASALIETALEHGVFDEVDYLNVSVPHQTKRLRGICVTRPVTGYRTSASRNGTGEFRIRIGGRIDDGERGGPVTDHEALARNAIAISPFVLPLEPIRTDAIETVAAELTERFV